ncbi:MAG: hypothetical protein AB2417_01460 [Clostridiaceae bacterium]
MIGRKDDEFMIKANMYKIYSIPNGDLEKKEFTEEELLEREITLSENNLIRKYLIFKDIKRGNMHLDNIIKVALPDDKENNKALEMLNNGITFMGKKFIPLVSSPSMMKKEGEDDYYEEDFKCEYLFIAEEDKKFIEIFEDITSLSKLTVKRANKEKIAINKDVVARLSLNTSSSYEIKYSPNIVILPSTTYTYVSNYCYFKDQDYSKLEYIGEHEKEFEFQDGCGLMSFKMAEIIQKNIGVNYHIDWAGIRLDKGLAVKGLLVKVDFNSYFKEMYKEDIQNVFEKREDGFYTLDLWENMVNISNADIIINTNMAKWARWWDSEEELYKELKKEKYDKYRYVLTNLYVTKFNKKQPKEYSRTNYQLISNLALTPKELEELSQETFDMYKKVLSMDINYVNLLLGDIVSEESLELNALDKTHYLLQSTEDALTIPPIRKTIINMINKKIRELAEGKFYVKGNYKVASTCPITFMDWIMTRKFSNNGLKENEFYIPKETGKRVMSRNPLNSFSEIHKFTIAKNKLLEKYCGDLTSEIIFFNQKDNRAMLNSGEDFDTDTNFVIENEIIYNSVVLAEDGYNFLNTEDNKKAIEMPYTKENEYYCVLKASGNAIGSIANIGMRICTIATEIGYYFPKNDDSYGYKELREMFFISKREWFEENITEIKEFQGIGGRIDDIKDMLKNFKYTLNQEEVYDLEWELDNLNREYSKKSWEVDRIKKKYFKQALEEKINKNELIPIETLEEHKIKDILIKQFYKYKKQSYLALQLQMIAIDMPKTLKEVDKGLIKVLMKEINEKENPIFRKYTTKYDDRKDKNGREKRYSNTHSVLNLHAKKIAKTLMQEWYKKNEDIKKYAKSDRVGCVHTILNNAKVTEYTTEVTNLVKAIFNSWSNNAERIRSTWKDNISKRNEELKKNNLQTSQSIIVLTEKYEIDTMATALLHMSRSKNSAIRTKFIIDCCFNVVQSLLDTYFNDIYAYKEDLDGEYNWMFKNYKKIKTVRKEQDMQAIENKQNEITIGEIILIKFRPIDMGSKFIVSKNEDKFYINDEMIYNNKVKGMKKCTYDLLVDLLSDKTELEVSLKDIEIKTTYISASIIC